MDGCTYAMYAKCQFIERRTFGTRSRNNTEMCNKHNRIMNTMCQTVLLACTGETDKSLNVS